MIRYVLSLLFTLHFGAVHNVRLIDTSGCGGSKGCWLMPQGCNSKNVSTDCHSIVTWSAKPDGLYIEIEGNVNDVQSYGGKYVAMAFSYDDKMGEDAVLECVLKPNGNVSAYLSFNDETHNFRMGQASKSMLKNTEGAYLDGRIVCRTLRSYEPSDDIPDEDKFKLFNLKDDSYTLLFAKGPLAEDESGRIGMHYLNDGDKFPWVATEDIRVTQNTNINTMKHYDIARSVQYNLVKVHGVFMLFAWWICGAIAILFSRFFKATWAATKLSGLAVWFQMHRGLMIACLILQCIAFAFIFIQAGDFKTCSYICTSDDYALKVHTILGVTCTAAALIQPFMAWFRPLPTSKNRPIFNWLHWFVGTGAWIIATVTIFLSTSLGKAGLRRNYGYAADYLMAGYIASFILTSIVLEILAAFYTSKAGKTKGGHIPMATVGPRAKVTNGLEIPHKAKQTYDTQQGWILIAFGILAFAIVIALTVLICLPEKDH